MVQFNSPQKQVKKSTQIMVYTFLTDFYQVFDNQLIIK